MDAVVSMFAGIVQRIDDALRPHVTIEPLQPPPPFDPVAFQAQVEAELRRLEDEEAARPLLPSTDYRTNPRPVQVPVEDPAPTLDALRAGLLARGPRGDALRAAVARAMVRDL